MHIIFGDAAEVISKNYTVLELDSFRTLKNPEPVKAYCVLTKIPLGEFSSLETHRNIHIELIIQYRAKNWEYCDLALSILKGKWGGEVDSFYNDLQKRVDVYKENPPGDDWNWALLKADKADAE